jgi:Zn-dependent M28 family amino/carboxypeptidase
MPKLTISATLAVAAPLMAATPVLAAPADTVDSTNLRNAVTIDNIRAHQRALQRVANRNDGTRASGTPGYKASVDYVVSRLPAGAYSITRQLFEFPFFQELSDAEFERVSPDPRVYALGTDFLSMEYSGSAPEGATGPIVPVDLVLPPGAEPSSSTSGCEAADFEGFTAGGVALLQRGTCDFGLKASNAQAAGAVGAIIFNEGQEGRQELLDGTLGGPVVSIPVVGTTFAVGEELAELTEAGEVTVRLRTETASETRTSENVLAETRVGRPNRVVVVGAHLDSVLEGPGINDNGSGTAVILEIARQMANLPVRNKVRFAFWGAEENGLLGSEYYVAQLSERERRRISVNLNFDMLGSPNFVRFVYDGNGDETPLAGPDGSALVEQVFLDYFASRGLATEPTAFDGRSDYGPFIAVGIPAGGLFSGAEGIKTPEEAATYGGTAGEAYDPCYHQACDTFRNVSLQALDELGDATAHAALQFAMRKRPVTDAVAAGAEVASVAGRLTAQEMEYQGHRLRK